jgi:CDP-glycerol glycerophosphotransferase
MISVVVPIYNVEDYVAECLESVAAQTVDDLEVVMVDDGSTDSSAAIARAFAARDSRFRLLSRPNGGLSRARNTGIEAARGDFIAFLDSDDLLPPDAYELLLRALEQTGSDFATGNVLRRNSWGTSQALFLADTFAATRLGTHVTEFPLLLADRTAWNKLWRRRFWDEHAGRFPEGVVHEDIPVVLPAHFKARSVDVIANPVYLYRSRDDGQLSITQRRREPKVLRDRLAAIAHVSDYLAAHGPAGARRRYHERVLVDDLRLHLLVLDSADAGYQQLFLDAANEFLDGADADILESLPPPHRRTWQLVRRRELPELLRIVRAETRPTLKMRLARRVPVRIRPQVRRAVRALRRRD